MDDKDVKNSRWYPGKYVGGAPPKVGVDAAEEDKLENKNLEDGKRGWYPGKLVAKTVRRVSVSTDDKKNHISRDSIAIKAEAIGEKADEDTFFPVEKKKPQYNNLEAIGAVKIIISDIKYLNLAHSNFLVELEDMAAFFEYNEAFTSFERTFELKDVRSDIVVTVTGSTINNSDSSASDSSAGIVIIPVVSLISFLGSPVPVKDIWRQIFPVYCNRSKLDNKFVSGFMEAGGYALNKPHVPIGFVSISVDLVLYDHPLQAYFKGVPNYGFQTLFENETDELKDVKRVDVVDSVSDDVLLSALLRRDVSRLGNSCLPPACIAPLLGLPEVFILVAVSVFFCYSLQIWQLPMFCFFLSLFNGVCNKLNRSFTHVVVWNESGLSSSINNAVQTKQPLVLRSLLVSHGQCLRRFVHNLELLQNLYSFADTRVSVLFFAWYFAVSVILSLLLVLFSMRTLICLTITSSMLVYGCGEVVEDWFKFRTSNNSSAQSPLIHLQRMICLMECYFSKVPDELEMIHRYIAGSAIVNVNGAEMSDAALLYSPKK